MSEVASDDFRIMSNVCLCFRNIPLTDLAAHHVCRRTLKCLFIIYFTESIPKPAFVASQKDEEIAYDQDPTNPFNEPDVDSSQYGNPFDETDLEADTSKAEQSPPKASKKNVHPVDMSKYLYAHTAPADEEELDEYVLG